MNTIKLEFANLTAPQAHHILEAYAEAQGISTKQAIPQVTATIDTPPLQQAAPADTGNDIAERTAAAGKVDNRGVPFHEQHHSPRFKEDGSWARRRNHDKPAADAYEAQFVGNGNPPQQAAGVTAASTNATSTPSPQQAAPVSTAAPSQPTAEPQAAMNAPTASASPDAAPPVWVPYIPTVEEYKAKWVELCQQQKVSGEHQTFIEKTYGGHPTLPPIMADNDKRTAIWIYFDKWSKGIKGF